jgi:hypothetical protein
MNSKVGRVEEKRLAEQRKRGVEIFKVKLSDSLSQRIKLSPGIGYDEGPGYYYLEAKNSHFYLTHR